MLVCGYNDDMAPYGRYGGRNIGVGGWTFLSPRGFDL